MVYAACNLLRKWLKVRKKAVSGQTFKQPINLPVHKTLVIVTNIWQKLSSVERKKMRIVRNIILLIKQGVLFLDRFPELGLRSQKRKNALARIFGETPTTSFQHLHIRALCLTDDREYRSGHTRNHAALAASDLFQTHFSAILTKKVG